MRSLLLVALAVTACVAVVIPRSQDNIAECLMCEMAVRTAAPKLEKDTEIIEKEFDKECKKELKIPFADKQCEKYVDEHLDKIIQELESGTAPKDVCTVLHKC